MTMRMVARVQVRKEEERCEKRRESQRVGWTRGML